MSQSKCIATKQAQLIRISSKWNNILNAKSTTFRLVGIFFSNMERWLPKLVTGRVVLKLKANIFRTKFWYLDNRKCTHFKRRLELHFECWIWQICMWQRTLEMYNSTEQYQLKTHYIGWILQSAYMRRISTAFMFIKIAFMQKK